MSLVGGFPSLREMARKTVRGEVNPLDKSTVVSIYPRPINFENVTLTPGRWYLEAGSPEKPAIMVIGPSSWWKDVGPDEPLIEIPVSSVQVANSLCRDYLNGLFACNMGDTMPGLFFVPGAFTLKELREQYGELLRLALKHQSNYYRALIKFGDSLWARSNGNPLVINDEMRLAARTLGAQDKDWMRDHINVGMVPCFACGEFKNPEYAICKACHSIDPDHPKAKYIQRVDPFFAMTDNAKAPKQPEGK